MRIAQIAPLYERVPPKLYGGTERVVSYLTEALVEAGHEVTLFASGDSLTKAKLIAPTPTALRLHEGSLDPLAHHVLLLEKIMQKSTDFDILHFHIDYLHFPISRRQNYHHLTTLHGRLDLPDLLDLYREFYDMPVISISEDQRKPLPWIDWKGTVYHGLPKELFSFHEEPGKYLAFIGRISPEKRVDWAIELARQSEMPLKIAAKVDKVDQAYFEEKIKPLLDHPLIEYIGEIGEKEKEDFLGNALALVFPIDWPEPFGLAMIEALACGTPVIARRRGSIPEVIHHGKTGFVFESLEEGVQAIKKIHQISRHHCREVFETQFTSSRMAKDYLKVYQKIIRERTYIRGVPLEKEAVVKSTSVH